MIKYIFLLLIAIAISLICKGLSHVKRKIKEDDGEYYIHLPHKKGKEEPIKTTQNTADLLHEMHENNRTTP